MDKRVVFGLLIFCNTLHSTQALTPRSNGNPPSRSRSYMTCSLVAASAAGVYFAYRYTKKKFQQFRSDVLHNPKQHVKYYANTTTKKSLVKHCLVEIALQLTPPTLPENTDPSFALLQAVMNDPQLIPVIESDNRNFHDTENQVQGLWLLSTKEKRWKILLLGLQQNKPRLVEKLLDKIDIEEVFSPHQLASLLKAAFDQHKTLTTNKRQTRKDQYEQVIDILFNKMPLAASWMCQESHLPALRYAEQKHPLLLQAPIYSPKNPTSVTCMYPIEWAWYFEGYHSGTLKESSSKQATQIIDSLTKKVIKDYLIDKGRNIDSWKSEGSAKRKRAEVAKADKQ